VVTCQDLPVADFVDGELDAIAERRVEAHLAHCESCRSLVADLRTIRAAAFTLDRREPPPDLLGRLRQALAAERAPARGTWWPETAAAWRLWLAAAAALALTTAIGVLPLLRSDTNVSPVDGTGRVEATALVDSVEADLRAAESHYEKAIQGLEQIARLEGAALDPQVAAVLQKNLQVVDQAIDETRAALRQQPSSADAQDSLFEAMRTKVALLQQTVELINEMRKGNQAEAGRLMQDLAR
jgi:anti-sigma factor RsiW